MTSKTDLRYIEDQTALRAEKMTETLLDRRILGELVMSTIKKSIATTISMIVLVLSLAVISPTTAIGKGNKRTANTARSDKSASRGSLNRVGGKMHLEDVSLGIKPRQSLMGADTVTINDRKRR